MLGTEKFLQYFEENAGLNPSRFLRKDGSGSLDIARANINKMRMRFIYCLTGRKGKEYLVIPVGCTNRGLFALLLSGNCKPDIKYFHRRLLKINFRWLQGIITPVNLDELPLYLYHQYKTIFLTNILQGTTKIELPITNKVIKTYTQAGIYDDVSYIY
jgi:hypothetical protein